MVLRAKAKALVDKHRVTNRTVQLLVNGKKVTSTKTDSRGVAVFRVDEKMVKKGNNAVLARYQPGTSKYRYGVSKAMVIKADSRGRVLEVK